MAIGVHIARVGFFQIDSVGNVLKKNDPSVTLGQAMSGSSDHRIIEDAAISTTSGYPTVKAYLEAEAANDYVLEHMDQNMIITYHRTSTGGFGT